MGPNAIRGLADAHRIRLGVGAPIPIPGGEVGQEIDGAEEVGGEQDLVEAVAHQHQADVDEAPQPRQLGQHGG
jgi:hypothetical protein